MTRRKEETEAPRHPTVKAALLMIGVAVAITLLAALPLLTGR